MNQHNKSGFPGWARVALIIIPYIITLAVTQGFGFLITGVSLSEDHSTLSLSQTFIVTLLGLIGSFLIIGIFRIRVDKKSLISLGFQMPRFSKDVFVGLAIGAMIMLFGFVILLALGETRIEQMRFDWSNLVLSFFLFVCVSFSEEILMRGYVLNNFMDSWNKYLSLVISAFIFAALHLANPNFSWIGMANIFIAGLILGLSYIYTRNLWFPIALHFSWNFFQGPVFGFHVSGQETWSVVVQSRTTYTLMNGGAFGFEGSLLGLIFEAISLAVVFFLFRNRKPGMEIGSPERAEPAIVFVEANTPDSGNKHVKNN